MILILENLPKTGSDVDAVCGSPSMTFRVRAGRSASCITCGPTLVFAAALALLLPRWDQRGGRATCRRSRARTRAGTIAGGQAIIRAASRAASPRSPRLVTLASFICHPAARYSGCAATPQQRPNVVEVSFGGADGPRQHLENERGLDVEDGYLKCDRVAVGEPCGDRDPDWALRQRQAKARRPVECPFADDSPAWFRLGGNQEVDGLVATDVMVA